MAKIVNMYQVPKLYSQKDGRYRYEAVKENVLGLKNICGEVVVYPPGAAGATHRHIGTEHLFFITEGSGTMYIDDAPHEVSAGDFVAVLEGERHSFRNHTDRTFAFLELFAPTQYKTIWDQMDLK